MNGKSLMVGWINELIINHKRVNECSESIWQTVGRDCPNFIGLPPPPETHSRSRRVQGQLRGGRQTLPDLPHLRHPL